MNHAPVRRPSGLTRLAVAYVLMIAGTFAAFAIIRHLGRDLGASLPPGRAAAAAPAASHGTLGHVLLALATILAASRTLGAVFRRLNQPPVIGEVLAGILLGPSLLGRVFPEAAAQLLPPSVAPVLGVIAQLGVILYMFLVGLELDTTLLKERGHATVAISHTSIVAPFLLGSVLALFLYPGLSGPGVSFTAFALFLGVAMSVTAFPVLARILTDRGMSRTRLGTMALTCAAVDDVTAWCLLSVVVAAARAEIGSSAWVLLGAAGFIFLMIFAARPVLLRWVRHAQGSEVSTGLLSFVLGLVLISAWASESIGIHAVFGAFLLGAILPHDGDFAHRLRDRTHDVVAVLLLPAFFAVTGMRTQIGLVSTAGEWLTCGLILLVATVGKVGGSLVAARLTGSGWREATAIGVMMNTRGLMELIVLNIGLDLGVISPKLFAMMVLMALATTIATAPLLHLLAPGAPRATDAEEGVDRRHAAPGRAIIPQSGKGEPAFRADRTTEADLSPSCP